MNIWLKGYFVGGEPNQATLSLTPHVGKKMKDLFFW